MKIDIFLTRRRKIQTDILPRLLIHPCLPTKTAINTHLVVNMSAPKITITYELSRNCRQYFTWGQTTHCSACSKPVLCFYKSQHSCAPVQVGGFLSGRRGFTVDHQAQITRIVANNHEVTGIIYREGCNWINAESQPYSRQLIHSVQQIKSLSCSGLEFLHMLLEMQPLWA